MKGLTTEVIRHIINLNRFLKECRDDITKESEGIK
jgi:hypothetical protein